MESVTIYPDSRPGVTTMPRLKPDEKRAVLLEQKAKLEAQLRALDSKQKQIARKEDTRRKVIAGALALEHMEHHPHDPFAVKMRELLARYVEPHSRHLFPNLPTIVSESEGAAAAKSDGAQVAA